MSEKLTEEQVRAVAKLSRLKLSEEEVHHFSEQLSAVLAHVAKLEELDTDDVEPMAHALDMHNVLRADEPTPGMRTDAALANAPESDPPFFKVPTVIDDGGGA